MSWFLIIFFLKRILFAILCMSVSVPFTPKKSPFLKKFCIEKGGDRIRFKVGNAFSVLVEIQMRKDNFFVPSSWNLNFDPGKNWHPYLRLIILYDQSVIPFAQKLSCCMFYWLGIVDSNLKDMTWSSKYLKFLREPTLFLIKFHILMQSLLVG